MALKQAAGGSPEWKTAEEATLLTFALDEHGRPIRIGGRIRGNVFLGRVRFADGCAHDVAVKRFIEPLDDGMKSRYEKVIEDLLAAGVRIPKTGFVKLHAGTTIGSEKLSKEEWVSVQELYGSKSRGSKLGGYFLSNPKMPTNVRVDAVIEATKIANAGYAPHFDAFATLLLGGRQWTVKAHDLDILAEEGGNRTPKERAGRIYDGIKQFDQINPGEYEQLFNSALEAATPEMRDALIAERNSRGVIFDKEGRPKP